jgi:hypothetical protein
MKTKQLQIIFAVVMIFIITAFNVATGKDVKIRNIGGVLGAEGKILPGIKGNFDANEYFLNKEPINELVLNRTGLEKFSALVPWDTLGSGVNGVVYAITVSGSDVYVGGSFIKAGGVAAVGIAKWNGSTWSALGSGLNGYGHSVKAIAVSGTDVYVGRSFAQAGGVTANCIAKWNGSAWSALGTGTNSIVNAIAVSGNDVFVGGSFTVAGGDISTGTGGVTAIGIAKWNGSAWSALGIGLNGYGGNYASVNAMVVSGSNVYVGGYFIQAGGIAANGIAQWNGSTWSVLGKNPLGSLPAEVNAIVLSGAYLYIAESENFQSSVSKWDGITWSTLMGVGSFSSGQMNAIAVLGNDVYVGGVFPIAGGQPSYFIEFNGATNSWNNFGSGANFNINTIAVSGTDVYFGGTFTRTGVTMANGTPEGGSIPATNIAILRTGYFTQLVIDNNNDLKPEIYALLQNYPNPFNPSTTIQYGLPARSSVRLVIYNILGQIVKELINAEQKAGYQSVLWNANVSSGIYFYRIEATSKDDPSKRFTETKKMLLLR